MDGYGAEILAAVLLMARMRCADAMDETVMEEHVSGRFPMTIALREEPTPLITVITADDEQIAFPVHIWDRLYLELTLACAHAREMAVRGAKLH